MGNQIKLRSTRLDGKWYEVKTFTSLRECNEFLGSNEDFGLLCVKKNHIGEPVYVVAKNNDKGVDKLVVTFESEDTGFCQRYYRANCGRLFVVVDNALHTCNDDAWREPDSPVNEEIFIING